MILQKARKQELRSIIEFYKAVTQDMESKGLRQWHWGTYPNEEVITASMEAGTLYRVYDDQGVLLAVTVDQSFDEEYARVNWLFGVRPGSFHRLAIRPDKQGEGYGKKVLDDVEELLRRAGCDALRFDTYTDNVGALKLYATRGCRTAGRLMFNGRPKPFICFEKALVEHCAMLPLTMHPAFRGGSLTPWGGDKLLRVYDKPIRDIPTGESLEVSCIKNLESTDDMGTSLPELIKRYGADFAGRFAFEPFPLLLKLIDAKTSLSVQVHPDDTYANANEGGKLGKTEAWLVLDAPEGAELVYGIKPGTTREELQAACEQGAAVEPLLRRVKVKAGDVCYIPSGCVHALGDGIMIYEIQQSSDITYRFYDWDRVDAKGNRRELHLAKALDVTDLSFALEPVPAPEEPLVRVLDEKYFTLDLMRVAEPVKVPAVHEFGMITALEGDLTIVWENGNHRIAKGETVYLPAKSPAYTLTGTGRAALSMPR